MNTERIDIRMSPSLMDELKRQAEYEGRTRQQHIRELVKAEQKRLKRNKEAQDGK